MLTDFFNNVWGLGLSDLIVVLVLLLILKLEIRVMLKIVGILIVAEIIYLVVSDIPPDSLLEFVPCIQSFFEKAWFKWKLFC